MVEMLIPAFAPELIVECVEVEAVATVVAVEEGVEVSLASVVPAVVLVNNDVEVKAAPLAELTCVLFGVAIELIELVVELAELVVLVFGNPWSSHWGKMQNHSRSLAASTGTVWPTLAADIPMSFEPSPYTILVYPDIGVSVTFCEKVTSSTSDHPSSSLLSSVYGYISSIVPCQL